MWEKLSELGQSMNMPWLILGDFNCVKSPTEKQLAAIPTWYELKDFADYCLSLGLNDAPTTGCYFTWYSNSESNPVWYKLDRVLCNNEWLEAGLQCNAHFSPSGCLFDHSSGIVSILDLPASQPKPFRFFIMWANHQDFIATVENDWNLNVDGTAQFSLCRKLKALKGHLKAFNNLHFSHISIRAKDAGLALQDAQLQLESNPENAAIRDSVGELRKKVVLLAEAERHFYYQKAKLHFLEMGDRNTKYFHDMVKRNAAKSSILAITKTDGSTITSAVEIGQEFVTYFTSLLGTKVQTLTVDNAVFNWGPKLSSELALELCRAITPVEVKQAIFHISDNKAPGPDGYSACFFKTSMAYLGNQVCMAVLDFFWIVTWSTRQLNHSIIALVPKSDHYPTVADYRPISCNVIYKAVMKIIGRWPLPWNTLTDRCQAAFVGGRSIMENIFLAQEMVRQYKRKRISPRLALNGSLHGFFAGKKELRQGDPMSPALFLLCIDYFLRLIKRKTIDSDFNFHPKCEKLKITHLLFADDLMVFSRGDLPSVHILMECLQEFRNVSAVKQHFTAGIENNMLREIIARTEFARGEMPVRSLGIPSRHRGCQFRDYSHLTIVSMGQIPIAAWSPFSGYLPFKFFGSLLGRILGRSLRKSTL
ncbi:UNVERIFIED_CONTAM: hypothetical protein Scaly_1932600 [Sesamum calycinum]|uniref:Reverse transcriptase domain-containing protein n=1 Tax=Sesamum calycinum TaxID=2727403 RepID=A0AAW2NIU8_9LAMI